MSPAELMRFTALLTQTMREMSAGLTAAVQALVEEGWTEPQARELVAAMMANSLRGQAAPQPETEESAA